MENLFKCSWLVYFLPLSIGLVGAQNLYVAHYSGAIYLLSFTNSSGSHSLSTTATIQGGGSLPSWLTYEPSSRTLYSSDEVFFGTGSISSFSAAADGRLTQTGKASATNGAVANVLYGGADGKGFIASAHYQSSAVSTFKLPLSSSSTSLQTLTFTMPQKGPNPVRQDAPHPHHVIVDPTGGFLLAPDLGADMIRIWSIDKSTGLLTSCPSLNVTAGAGPRHAVFWTSPTSGIRRQTSNAMLYVANELSNTISAFSVTYPAAGCLSFAQKQNSSPFPNNQNAPRGTKVAEVHVKGNFLYNSNRADKSFSGNDSIATWALSPTGAISFQGFTSSYGTYPRTFSINKAGTFLAIGDQTTSNVAIVQRDLATGVLGDLVANLRIGNPGTPENEDGLSSVVWAEE